MDSETKTTMSTKPILCSNGENCGKRFWSETKEDCKTCKYNQTANVDTLIRKYYGSECLI